MVRTLKFYVTAQKIVFADVLLAIPSETFRPAARKTARTIAVRSSVEGSDVLVPASARVAVARLIVAAPRFYDASFKVSIPAYAFPGPIAAKRHDVPVYRLTATRLVFSALLLGLLVETRTIVPPAPI